MSDDSRISLALNPGYVLRAKTYFGIAASAPRIRAQERMPL
jgi:hypothetical protein